MNGILDGQIATDVLTFDQHQRYGLVRQVVSVIKKAIQTDRIRILDVGGYFRSRRGKVAFPLSTVLPNDYVNVVDLIPPPLGDCGNANYVCGSGIHLPFVSGAFDVAVSCDTLEHIPAEDRENFIFELNRVSRYAFVVMAPIDSPNTVLAERIVDEFIRLRLGGPQPALTEHRLYGLPTADAVLSAMQQLNLKYCAFPCEDLYGWLFMMLANHYLMGIPGAEDLERLITRFYVQNFPQGARPWSEADRSYRHLFLGSKDGTADVITRVTKDLEAAPTKPNNRNADAGFELGLMLSHLLLSGLERETESASAERLDLDVSGASEPLGEMRDGTKICQSFISRRPNLCRIDVVVATYGRPHSGIVRLTLREGGAQGLEVAQCIISAFVLSDNKWCAFRFPPQLTSKNREYCFELEYEQGRDDSAITLHYLPTATIPGLARLEHGSPVVGELMFRTYFIKTSVDEEWLAREADLRATIDAQRSDQRQILQAHQEELRRLLAEQRDGLESVQAQHKAEIDKATGALQRLEADLYARQAQVLALNDELSRVRSSHLQLISQIMTRIRA